MKNAKQFFLDYSDNELLRNRILEEMASLRGSGDTESWRAGQKVALALGYDIPDEVAKTILARDQENVEYGTENLSDEEARTRALTDPHLPACRC